MLLQPSYIREMAKKGQINFTKHALVRMGERKIWIDDVREAILYGEVIEVQDKDPRCDIRVLFQEATDKVPRFYVVVAASFPTVDVISVAEFEEQVWEWLGKIMARRRT